MEKEMVEVVIRIPKEDYDRLMAIKKQWGVKWIMSTTVDKYEKAIIAGYPKNLDGVCEYEEYGECTYRETGCADCKAKLKALGYLKKAQDEKNID